MKISERLLQMTPSATRAISDKAGELKSRGVQIISFSSGEPDFEAPEASMRYALKAMQDGQTHYTATAGLIELKEAVIEYYRERFRLDYANNEIIIGAGAKPLIFEALGALVDPGDEVILTAPSWVSYVEQIRFFGGKPVIVETQKESLDLDIDDIARAITPRTVALIINSPQNPTGKIYSKELVQDLCRLIKKHDLFLINDEIYERITFDGLVYRNPLCFAPAAREHVLNINGVSKAYAMTGWRIGFGLGPEILVKKMTSLQGHLTSGACSIAQWAAVGAIKEAQKDVAEMVTEYQKRKEMVVKALGAMPHITFIEPQGAFYAFINIGKTCGRKLSGQAVKDDIDFCRKLLEKSHVAAVPGSAFLLPGYIRISFATSRENIDAGMKRIRGFLEELE